MLKTFVHHVPTDEAILKVRELRNRFSDLAEFIQTLTPGSRELSLAMTSLENRRDVGNQGHRRQ